MRIGFDFDGTLTDKRYYDLANGFISRECDVHIVTARNINGSNDDLFGIAKRLGIRRDRIIFTNYEPKLPIVKDFDLHFDDDSVEIEDINMHGGKCLGILVESNYINRF